MNRPSSTITAAGLAGFFASTVLLCLKIWAPEFYVQIPPEYQGHLVTAFVFIIGYLKKENVLPLKE